jgi:hypothetical protein
VSKYAGGRAALLRVYDVCRLFCHYRNLIIPKLFVKTFFQRPNQKRLDLSSKDYIFEVWFGAIRQFRVLKK